MAMMDSMLTIEVSTSFFDVIGRGEQEHIKALQAVNTKENILNVENSILAQIGDSANPRQFRLRKKKAKSKPAFHHPYPGHK
jgi:hypothetical protein